MVDEGRVRSVAPKERQQRGARLWEFLGGSLSRLSQADGSRECSDGRGDAG